MIEKNHNLIIFLSQFRSHFYSNTFRPYYYHCAVDHVQNITFIVRGPGVLTHIGICFLAAGCRLRGDMRHILFHRPCATMPYLDHLVTYQIWNFITVCVL